MAAATVFAIVDLGVDILFEAQLYHRILIAFLAVEFLSHGADSCDFSRHQHRRHLPPARHYDLRIDTQATLAKVI
ncbi:hypothetical protein D3C76_1760420 [compost metagenome]